MKPIIFLLGLFYLTSMFVPPVKAVDFILRNSNGVYIYNCVNSCGPVQVRKSGKCEFFVQSVYYNGIVKACEAEIAALKACGELKFDQPIKKELLNPACR
ncbi:hypothetical protein KKI24_12290 [bacterium]|nr:hypothetical protein [bacterium]